MIQSEQLLVEAAFAMNSCLYFLHFSHAAAAHIRCFIGTLGAVLSFSRYLGTKIAELEPFWLESSRGACEYLRQTLPLTVVEPLSYYPCARYFLVKNVSINGC